MLGSLLILALGGNAGAAAFPLAATPLVVAPLLATAAASAMPLLLPAPLAFVVFPLLWVPALVALS